MTMLACYVLYVIVYVVSAM